MIQLADEVFATRNDPDQLDVNEDVIKHLLRLHPSTVTEYNEGNGPLVWLLAIPTTLDLMKKFIDNTITEKQLLDQTPLDIKYEAIYLCSALVLPEYRRKGIAKRLSIEAIENIRKDHPLKALFVWAFSKEGAALAENISQLNSLPLYKRSNPKT